MENIQQKKWNLPGIATAGGQIWETGASKNGIIRFGWLYLFSATQSNVLLYFFNMGKLPCFQIEKDEYASIRYFYIQCVYRWVFMFQ